MLAAARRSALAAAHRSVFATAHRSALVASTSHTRRLGSWAAAVEAARGADLKARQDLGDSLSDIWELHQDETEAKKLEDEAGSAPGSQLTFVLSVEGTAVAILRASLMPTGQATGGKSGLLIGAQVDPALSLSSVGRPLIRAASNELKLRGAGRIMAVAPLPGLCDWVAREAAWERLDTSADDYSPEQRAAVEAVATGRPRPGHSVLGVGTFKAAKPAFVRLAMEYAMLSLKDADAETAMFVAGGGEVQSINWMHATDPDALRDCAGCTALLRMPM